MIGLGLSITQLAVRQLVGQFNPMKLFALGEQGAWYDPSDLSTLYQDAAGTTPVTAVEQPVGLMLDKSGRGNHAFQTTATSRPVLSARVNQALNSGFSLGSLGGLPTDWLERDAVTGRKIADSSTLSGYAMRVTSTGVGGVGATSDVRQNVAQLVAGASYIASFKVKAAPGNLAATIVYVFTGVTRSATITGEYTQIISAPFVAVGSTHAFFFGGVNGLIADIADFQIVPADQADLPYQRVNTATDYDAGPAFPRYLRCDGIDDWMVTGTITPGTDKAQVFAGVRKLSDATVGVIWELGLSPGLLNGTARMAAPNPTGATYDFESRGTSSSKTTLTNASVAAPSTNVLTGLGDISGDRVTLRVDGAQAAENTADQGTGNYLDYPLYLFRRGGTTLPFNGHFYGGIIRFGPNLPIETIQQTEAYMAAKTGVTL